MFFRMVLSWFSRPLDPHAERDHRGAFYVVGRRRRKLRFDPCDKRGAAFSKLIAATQVFPPKGVGPARRTDEFGLYDKATDNVYQCAETPEAYLRTLYLIRADRAELLRVEPLDPRSIDWNSQ